MVNRNYFCAKSFKTYYDQENSAKMTEQLMDAAKTGEGSSEFKPKMKRHYKLKSKPSTLREMNVWAPTSM